MMSPADLSSFIARGRAKKLRALVLAFDAALDGNEVPSHSRFAFNLAAGLSPDDWKKLEGISGQRKASDETREQFRCIYSDRARDGEKERAAKFHRETSAPREGEDYCCECLEMRAREELGVSGARVLCEECYFSEQAEMVA